MRLRWESLKASDSVMCGSWGRSTVGTGVVIWLIVSGRSVCSGISSCLLLFDLSDDDLEDFRTSVRSESAGWLADRSSVWRCVAFSSTTSRPAIQPGILSRRERKLFSASWGMMVGFGGTAADQLRWEHTVGRARVASGSFLLCWAEALEMSSRMSSKGEVVW